jgi:uncharacterized OsmC-like protein
MNAGVIQQTVQLWENEPEKAKGTPLVKARTDGATTVLEAGPFSWRTDLPAPLGGTNEAASPTALLLGALAGCAAVFIRDTLAPQLGVRVDSVQATAQCRTDARGLLGMAGAAPDLEDLELSIQIQSPDSEARVQELYRTWQQRCPVYLALTKALSVKTTLTTSG